jgi:hypothetical protein
LLIQFIVAKVTGVFTATCPVARDARPSPLSLKFSWVIELLVVGKSTRSGVELLVLFDIIVFVVVVDCLTV